jgi:membrane-associated phospholipid phosphatase
MDKNKLVAIGLAVVVGLGVGFSTSLVDVIAPYSMLSGAIAGLVVAVVGIFRKPPEKK